MPGSIPPASLSNPATNSAGRPVRLPRLVVISGLAVSAWLVVALAVTGLVQMWGLVSHALLGT